MINKNVEKLFTEYERKIKELMAIKIKQAIIRADEHPFPYQSLRGWLETEFDIKRDGK